MLENVPEDDNVGALGRRAQGLDRRVANLELRVAARRVRLNPRHLVPLFGQLAEQPAVARPDFDDPCAGCQWAERTDDRRLAEAPQRVEQQVDGSGWRRIGPALVQTDRIPS